MVTRTSTRICCHTEVTFPRCADQDQDWFANAFAVASLPYGMNLDLSPSTAHQTTQELILRWFSICKDSHTECNAPDVNGSFMPTRIIEIDRTGHDAFFKLVDGAECAVESPYVTLSYCWGSQPASQAYRLLETTVKGIRSKNSVTTLPKTIRDAIEIAGYFKVQYLWVDRLCIFQDSAEDFQREASSMADVYKNAFLNIAALGAPDADGGCFFQRNPRYVVPTLVHIQHDGDSRPTPYVFEEDARRGWGSSFEKEPLVHRAWVVQERLLARRVVYFGSKQIFWECKDAHWCETHPRGISVSDISEHNKVIGNKRWHHTWERPLLEDDAYFGRLWLDSGPRDPYHRLFADWRGIVRLFGKCALSVPTDKLVAVSGLANEMKRKLDQLRPSVRHRYIAGLWENELLSVLPWCVMDPASRAASYRAPTWSWASIDGQVSFPQETSGNIYPFSSLISVEVRQPPGETETGQVENASITLLGPVLRAKIGSTIDWNRLTSVTFNVTSLCQASDTPLQAYPDSEAMAPTQFWIGSSRVCFDTINDICQDIFQIVIQKTEHNVEGLALALDDTAACTYRRIGYLRYQFTKTSSGIHRGPGPVLDFFETFQKRSIVIV